MAKYPAVITTMAGTNTIAEANASKQALIFTKIVIGAGDMPASIPSAISLTDKRLELAITKSVKTGDGQFMVQGLLSNKNLDAGFYAREIGLMAKVGENGQEVLFSYTNGGNYVDYIPDKNTPMDSYTFTITTVIGNTEKVQAIVSDNGIASVHDLEAHNTDDHAHNEQFIKYLLLTGGTLTGDVIVENGKWIIYRCGDYEGSVRITQSGTMDVGVNRKGVVDNLNLCTKIRPGWYNGNSSAKPIAMTEDISNHNTDETAHQSITSMIAKILGNSDWKANPAASLKDIKNLLGMGGIVAQRLEETGFIKFANGLIIQWGIFRKVAESEQGGNWNENQQVRRFPIQFATNKAVLVCGDSGIYSNSGNNALAAAVSGAVSVRGRIVDRTSFKVAVDASDGTVNADISYIAIGI